MVSYHVYIYNYILGSGVKQIFRLLYLRTSYNSHTCPTHFGIRYSTINAGISLINNTKPLGA